MLSCPNIRGNSCKVSIFIDFYKKMWSYLQHHLGFAVFKVVNVKNIIFWAMGRLIRLWLYKENNKLRDWKKKSIYSTYSPLSSTHLWLHCYKFFKPSKKNSFGCAANRKIGAPPDVTLSAFRRNTSPPSSEPNKPSKKPAESDGKLSPQFLSWRRYIHPKRRSVSKLHSVTTYKPAVFRNMTLNATLLKGFRDLSWVQTERNWRMKLY
jgi:hypothetical protein